MDKRLIAAEDFFDAYNNSGNLDSFYNTFSDAIERGWLNHFDQGKEFERAAKGRGKVTLIKTNVEKPNVVEEDNLATIRNQFSYKAVAHLN